MIHLVEGDILLSTAHAIAQGVCINDPMDKGLAYWPIRNVSSTSVATCTLVACEAAE